jgi:hypothetical protein
MSNIKGLAADGGRGVPAPGIDSPVGRSGLGKNADDTRPTGEKVSKVWRLPEKLTGWRPTVGELLAKWSTLPVGERKARYEEALRICKGDAERAELVEEITTKDFSRMLARSLSDIYRLADLAAKDKTAGEALRKAREAAGVRITGSTRNRFTPWVNWAFHGTPAANRTRFASALLCAKQKNVEVDEFAAFLEREGGIVACANFITEQRNKAAGLPSAKARAEAAAKELVKARMANALELKIARGADLPRDGVVAGLFKIEPGGNGLLLAWRPASDREVLSYGKTTPAASARRRRA